MDAGDCTEIWEIDAETGQRRLIERFDRRLSAQEAVDLAIATSLDSLGELTVEDLFPAA